MEKSLLDNYHKISIQQYKTDMGFKALVEGVHENLFVIPEYQRKYRWSKEQVEELAASLIRDLPIPPIYTYRNKDGFLEILDGQQRVMSLYFYYIGKFFKNTSRSVFDYRELDIQDTKNFAEALESKYELATTQFYMKVGGERYNISYQELPLLIKRKVDYITIPIVEIKVSDEKARDATLHKIFTNLNNGGEQLSGQELRNGIYPCNFSRMIDEVNRNNIKWRHLYGSVGNKCEDIERLYQFCTLKKYVRYKNGEFSIPEYEYSIKKLIDHFAEEAFDFSKAEIAEYRKSIEKFIDGLDISKKNFKKKLLIEGLYVVQAVSNQYITITDELCNDILVSSFYKETTNGGTISIKSMNKRWKGIYGLLSNNDKRFK